MELSLLLFQTAIRLALSSEKVNESELSQKAHQQAKILFTLYKDRLQVQIFSCFGHQSLLNTIKKVSIS